MSPAHTPGVLNLSDVVHDDTIADEPPADPPADPDHHPHPSRSPEFDPGANILSPLHDTYPVQDDTADNAVNQEYSVELLEREIATLLNQNATAASAALLNAAAQQRQTSTDFSTTNSEGGDGAQQSTESVASVGPGLSQLVAVLEALQTQTRGANEERRESMPKEQATRTAPAFHSLTASDSQDDSTPRKKHQGEQSDSERGAYLFSEDEHASDRDPAMAASEEARRHSTSPEHQTPGPSDTTMTDLPTVSVPGEYPDINDILNHFSAQFDPEASHPSPHDLSTPDASPVISRSRPVDSELSPPPVPTRSVQPGTAQHDRQEASQPIASTSTLPPPPTQETPKKLGKRSKDREKGPNQHVCDQDNCHKTFTRRSDLARHMRIHTGERPFVCTFANCGKTFIQRSALHVHSRVHTGEKPHCCEYPGCGKTFGDSSSLARHRRTHTGKRPYKCQAPTCEKTFTRRTTLTTHMRTHDPDWEPDPNVKYNFKGKKRRLGDEDENDLVESVRTISAIFQGGDQGGSAVDSSAPFEAQVASISAEIAAAIAQAQSRGVTYDDDDDEEEEDDDEGGESGSGQEMTSPETIGPNTSGIRGLDDAASKAGQASERDVDDDEDSDAFPQPLRARKSKEPIVAVGAKRKR